MADPRLSNLVSALTDARLPSGPVIPLVQQSSPSGQQISGRTIFARSDWHLQHRVAQVPTVRHPQGAQWRTTRSQKRGTQGANHRWLLAANYVMYSTIWPGCQLWLWYRHCVWWQCLSVPGRRFGRWDGHFFLTQALKSKIGIQLTCGSANGISGVLRVPAAGVSLKPCFRCWFMFFCHFKHSHSWFSGMVRQNRLCPPLL